MSHPPATSPAGSAERAPHVPAEVPAVEARGLVKDFGRRRAVNGVDLAIAGGECLALFGPNGVGLTAMLREIRASGAALLLIIHNLGEGLALATHAAVMRDGVFVRHDRRAALDPAQYAAEYRELLARAS